MKLLYRASSVFALFCAPIIAKADELNGGDTAWMLTASALVLFMLLPGLSLFYAGLVRTKNVLSVLMQCFTIACAMSLVWFAVGYSLAFSGDGNWIGNLDKAFLSGVSFDSMSGSIPESVFVLFQMTFIMITPALFVGGFSERMNFGPMLVFSIFWAILVYAPVCHWVWGGGWLADMGLLDFAGGTVVHITAGVSALVAAVVIGNRKGFPEKPMPPHNLTLTVSRFSSLGNNRMVTSRQTKCTRHCYWYGCWSRHNHSCIRFCWPIGRRYYWLMWRYCLLLRNTMDQTKFEN